MKCKHLQLLAKVALQNKNKKCLYSAVCEACNITCTHIAMLLQYSYQEKYGLLWLL